jgi:hypothetical protein
MNPGISRLEAVQGASQLLRFISSALWLTHFMVGEAWMSHGWDRVPLHWAKIAARREDGVILLNL